MTSQVTPPTAPTARADGLEGDEIMRGSQFRASVAAAAVGLVQAGIYEGKLHVSPQVAVEAAATVLQLIHGKNSMRLITTGIAKRHNIDNAYASIINRGMEAS